MNLSNVIKLIIKSFKVNIMNNIMRLPIVLAIGLSFPIYANAEDNVPPTCEATFVGFNDNGEKFAQFTTYDDTALLNTTITEMVNGTTSFYHSGAGNNTPTIFIATKIDQSQKAILNAEVTDTAGNVSNCSDAIVLTVKDNGKSDRKTYPSIPKKADSNVIVHVQNGNPGIDKLKIKVNGTPHEFTLAAGYQPIDISSFMSVGNNNEIIFTGTGDLGNIAYIIMIAN